MKIFCEYCGNRIDTEKDTKCPNCGASYRKNKDFIDQDTKNKEAKEKLMKTQEEVSNFVMDNFRRVNKFSKVFLIFPIVIFVLIFALAFSQIARNSSLFNSKSYKEVTVNINEYGKVKDYQAKVTEYKKLEDTFLIPKEGYEYVQFTIMIENLSGKRLTSEKVNCIVDGVAQNSEFISTIPLIIEKGLTVKGEITFEVPKDAESYNIRYGDYITIHIEK